MAQALDGLLFQCGDEYRRHANGQQAMTSFLDRKRQVRHHSTDGLGQYGRDLVHGQSFRARNWKRHRVDVRGESDLGGDMSDILDVDRRHLNVTEWQSESA